MRDLFVDNLSQIKDKIYELDEKITKAQSKKISNLEDQIKAKDVEIYDLKKFEYECQ